MENIKIILAVLAVKTFSGFIKLLKVLIPVCLIAACGIAAALFIHTVFIEPTEISPESPLNDWVGYKSLIIAEDDSIESAPHMEQIH